MVAATAAATHVPPTSLRTYLTLWAPRCPPSSTRPKQRQRQQMSCPSSANLRAHPAPVPVQLEQSSSQNRSKRFPARAKPATICCGCARTFSVGIACVQISFVNITRRSGEFICSNSCATVLIGFSFPLQLVYSVAAANQSVACCGQGYVGWQGAARLLNLAVSAQGNRCDGALQQVLGHLYAASGKAQEDLR